MNEFIEITNQYHIKELINKAAIRHVQGIIRGGSYLHLIDSRRVHILETYKEIKRMLINE